MPTEVFIIYFRVDKSKIWNLLGVAGNLRWYAQPLGWNPLTLSSAAISSDISISKSKAEMVGDNPLDKLLARKERIINHCPIDATCNATQLCWTEHPSPRELVVLFSSSLDPVPKQLEWPGVQNSREDHTHKCEKNWHFNQQNKFHLREKVFECFETKPCCWS